MRSSRLQEGMFSVERAAKLLLWTCLMYQYTEVEGMEVPIGNEILTLFGADAHDPSPAINAAMAMTHCRHRRVFWERHADTKAVVAWGRRTIVVAFRGTATVRNAKLDLQLYRDEMPDIPEDFTSRAAGACLPCSGRRPRVHAGFMASYQASGIKRKILALVMSLFASGEVKRASARVYTTGHSLGGALASMCAGAP